MAAAMGDQNQSQSKLNTIILGVASFGLATLIGIAMNKLDSLDEKVDKTNAKIDSNRQFVDEKLDAVREDQNRGRIDTAERLTKVETKLEQLYREVR